MFIADEDIVDIFYFMLNSWKPCKFHPALYWHDCDGHIDSRFEIRENKENTVPTLYFKVARVSEWNTLNPKT